MSWSYEDSREELLNTLRDLDPIEDNDKYNLTLDALDALNKAETAQYREPEKEIPETGVKAWFERHSDAFIKVGGTLSAIGLVAFAESKFDLIFRSKASKFI